ncbi:hypothetical protein GGGNBK_05110 [Sporosarcina sp. ANT_H38]
MNKLFSGKFFTMERTFGAYITIQISLKALFKNRLWNKYYSGFLVPIFVLVFLGGMLIKDIALLIRTFFYLLY